MRPPLIPVMVLLVLACSSRVTHDAETDGGGDAQEDDAPEGDGHADGAGEAGEAGVDGSEGGGLEPEPGSVTLVARRMAPLLDRHCDHDGDGVGDNAVADLGEPGSAVIVSFLGEVFGASLENGRDRVLIRFPRLDDRNGPSHSGEPLAVAFEGRDLDDPREPEDDFSGHEPLAAEVRTTDSCGEPLFELAGATLVDGGISGLRGPVPIPLSDGYFVALPDAQIDGSIESRGESAQLRACGYMPLAELGALADYRDELSILEILLLGGAALGIPSIPGLEPDVDGDGDGIEGFETDEDGIIERCVDGDGTVIEGRDCWGDPRIADGLSIVLSIEMVSAVFGGRFEEWEQGDDCGAVPTESLWSECATDADCAPGSTCAEMEEPYNAGIFLCR